MNREKYINKLNEELEELKEKELLYFETHDSIQEAQYTSRIFGVQYALNLARMLDEPQKVKARLAKHWDEDLGDCLWWNFPVEEPPYCGTPLDDDFPKYKTHFTELHIPDEVEEEPKYRLVLPHISKMIEGNAITIHNMKTHETKDLAYDYFTESEIKSIDERYWPFAVPVEKV